VAAQEVEFEASSVQLRASSVQKEIPELFFCTDLLGYGWCFRKGDFLNIGMGRLDPARLSAHVAQFCAFLRNREKVAGDIPQKFAGHAYQLYERVQPKLVDDAVLLVGDAAGLAYPQSGEGIRPAVESGLIAADVIMQAAGNYQRQRLALFEERITSRFGQPRSRRETSWLPGAWLRCMAARLLATHWFARHVVMDKWFLHSNQSALKID
jgi:flavin-dependent dehydrogenase